eukprot:SAG31_NODE_207_length_20316_cov_20.465400_4_plen_1865_part_00
MHTHGRPATRVVAAAAAAAGRRENSAVPAGGWARRRGARDAVQTTQPGIALPRATSLTAGHIEHSTAVVPKPWTFLPGPRHRKLSKPHRAQKSMVAQVLCKQVLLATYKNLVVKLKEKKKTAVEVFYPVYFVLILCAVHAFLPPIKMQAVPEFPSQDWVGSYVPTLSTGSPRPIRPIPRPIRPFDCILFAPNTAETTEVMHDVAHELNSTCDYEHCYNMPVVMLGFETEQRMEEHNAVGDVLNCGGQDIARSRVLGVVFRSLVPGATEYKIRLQYETATKLPDASTELVPPGDNSTVEVLIESGFLLLVRSYFLVFVPTVREIRDFYRETQRTNRESITMYGLQEHSLNRVLHRQSAAGRVRFPTLWVNATLLQRFPFPGWVVKYRADGFFAYMVPIYIPVAFMSSVSILVISIVEEKEKKIKEGMRMVGLSESAYFFSWVLTQCLISGLSVAVATYFIRLGGLFPRTDISIVFLALLSYVVSMVPVCVIISLLFKKSKNAAQATNIFAVQILIAIPLKLLDGHIGLKRLASVFGPVAIGQIFIRTIELETEGSGLQWSNIYTSNGHGAISVSIALVIMNTATICCSLLAVYLSFVLPGEYGVRRSPFFLFQHCIAQCQRCRNRSVGVAESSSSILLGSHVGSQNARESENHSTATMEAPVQEAVRRNAGDPKVIISHLRKVYEGKKETVAVKDLNLRLYEDQIFSLLGHNGAGKSSVIGALSALFAPTAGDILVYGHDIKDADTVRPIMGICPQHDILFEKLTCRQHLRLFAGIKGVLLTKKEIDRLLNLVDLLDKRDSIAADLSGGQKRKLSVAIALMEEPKLLILDEPTAGMDPMTRRKVWSLLQQGKAGRVTLLTTHYMDEADILGDRIGIMHSGELKCIGSSLFLKNRYGVGYIMSVAKLDGCDEDKLHEFVSQHVPSAVSVKTVGKDCQFQLPFGMERMFPTLFDGLDTNKGDLLISSYGVSVTTLEQVFLRVCEEFTDTEDENGLLLGASSFREDNPLSADILPPQTRRRGQQLLVMLRKHLWTIRKEYVQYLLLAASSYVYVVIGLTREAPKTTSPTLDLNVHSAGFHTDLPISSGTASRLNSHSPHYTPCLSKCLASGVDTHFAERLTGIGGLLLESTQHHVADVAVDFSFRPSLAKNSDCASAEYATLLYNASIPWALPAFVALLDSCMLVNTTDAITLTAQSFDNIHPTILLNPSTSIFVSLAFAYMPSFFIATVVKEKMKHKIIHQLLVMGIDKQMLWLSYLLADGMFLVVCFLTPVWITCWLLDIPYLTGSCFLPFVLVCLSALISTLVTAYWISGWFKEPESAVGIVLTAWMLITEVAFGITIGLQQASQLAPFIFPLAQLLDILFLIVIPPYTIVSGMNALYALSLTRQDSVGMSDLMVWSWQDREGRPFIGCLSSTVVPMVSSCLFWCLLTRTRTPKVKPAYDGDDLDTMDVRENRDVSHERSLIASGLLPKPNVVTVTSLRKEFKDKSDTKGKKGGSKEKKNKKKKKKTVAVADLTVGIPKDECFGLLGPNGAGKSTVLRILTGDETPDCGSVLIDGLSVIDQVKEVHKRTAFCPQEGGLWDHLTARQHFQLYCNLLGFSPADAAKRVHSMLEQLDMLPHADKMVKELSGGNKRKTSVGIALLGDSRACFLDEPSAGVDPATRRAMWRTIRDSTAGRALLLTTHSMEEADALSTRIGIMVNGRLQALGTPQKLKNDHGSFFTLEIKITDEVVAASVASWVEQTCPNHEVLESHGVCQTYAVPRDSTSLGAMFKAVETEKQRGNLGIEEYTISQTTLEQVFLAIAKAQIDPDEEAREEEVSRVTHEPFTRGDHEIAGASPEPEVYATRVVVVHDDENMAGSLLEPQQE